MEALSRSRQYITRAKDWVEWTLEKPPHVKNTELYYITGGPARHQQVKPKTWRILRHCHDYWSLDRGGATGGVWGGGTPPHSSANRQIIISVGKTVLAKDTH